MRHKPLINENNIVKPNETVAHSLVLKWVEYNHLLNIIGRDKGYYSRAREADIIAMVKNFVQLFNYLMTYVNQLDDQGKAIFILGLNNQQTYRSHIIGNEPMDKGPKYYRGDRLSFVRDISEDLAMILMKFQMSDQNAGYESVYESTLNVINSGKVYTGVITKGLDMLTTIRSKKVKLSPANQLKAYHMIKNIRYSGDYRKSDRKRAIITLLNAIRNSGTQISFDVLKSAYFAGFLDDYESENLRAEYWKRVHIPGIKSSMDKLTTQLRMIRAGGKKGALSAIKELVEHGIPIHKEAIVVAIELDQSVYDYLVLKNIPMDFTDEERELYGFHELEESLDRKDYIPIGDFSQEGAFTRPQDLKLSTNEAAIDRIIKHFSKIKQPIKLYISNYLNDPKFREYGLITRSELAEAIPVQKEVNRIIQGSAGYINIIVAGNFVSDTEKGGPLTAWILLHRTFHALSAGGKKEGLDANKWVFIENEFKETVHEIMVKCYGVEPNFDKDSEGDYSGKHKKLYLDLFHAIGKQGSSRRGHILRPREFILECCTYFMKTGQLSFNPFPDQIGGGHTVSAQSDAAKARGDPPRIQTYDTYHLKTEEIEWGNQKLQHLANLIKNEVNDVLQQSVGKIFFM